MFEQNYYFHGRHSEQADALYANISNVEGVTHKLFPRLLDVLLCAPLVGFLYQRKAPLDSSAARSNVMAEQMIREKKRLETVYNLIAILDKNEEADINRRLDLAFRHVDEEDEKKGMELFNAYARGGVEVLYENIIDGQTSEEVIIGNLVDFVNDFDEKFNNSLGVSADYSVVNI